MRGGNSFNAMQMGEVGVLGSSLGGIRDRT